MPLYYYYCSNCKKDFKFILEAEDKSKSCDVCKEAMTRTPKPPSSKKMEVLDNGWMPRRLERLEDAAEIHKERSDKHQNNDKT